MERERQTNQRNTVILQINNTDTILIYSFYLYFIYIIKSIFLFVLSECSRVVSEYLEGLDGSPLLY